MKVIERGAEDAAKGRLRRFGRTSTRDNDHFSRAPYPVARLALAVALERARVQELRVRARPLAGRRLRSPMLPPFG